MTNMVPESIDVTDYIISGEFKPDSCNGSIDKLIKTNPKSLDFSYENKLQNKFMTWVQNNGDSSLDYLKRGITDIYNKTTYQYSYFITYEPVDVYLTTITFNNTDLKDLNLFIRLNRKGQITSEYQESGWVTNSCDQKYNSQIALHEGNQPKQAETATLPLIPEPFQVSHIGNLEFTSGGLAKEKWAEFCSSSDNSFFGSYYLIDRNSTLPTPFTGTIIVSVNGNASKWEASDTTQVIWKINLKSDIISVWDSINIGLTKNEIIDFSKSFLSAFEAPYDSVLIYDYQSFTAEYIFSKDTLSELTVTRKCNEIK